jgi:folate-binding protein YgfZ
MNETQQLSGVVRLPHLGVIRAEGPDAAHFLHNQLTQDFLLLQDDQARLAGYCSAKGRLLASCIAWKTDPQTVLMVFPISQISAILKRLSMFVLRAKVKLSDITAQQSVWGLVGQSAESVLGARAMQAWSRVRDNSADAISLYPGLSQALALWVTPLSTAVPAGPTIDLATWQWAYVQSAVCLLPYELSEALVPQMINYESVGGINFKKGCYPGQEVVARSQFRGTLKRRGFLFSCATPAQPGQEIFHSSDPEQACGLVVANAAGPNDQYVTFASLQIAATQTGQLHCAHPDGPELTLLPLPYSLLDDI